MNLGKKIHRFCDCVSADDIVSMTAFDKRIRSGFVCHRGLNAAVSMRMGTVRHIVYLKGLT